MRGQATASAAAAAKARHSLASIAVTPWRLNKGFTTTRRRDEVTCADFDTNRFRIGLRCRSGVRSQHVPRTRLRAIRARIDRFDIALFQEAFTSVPSLLAGFEARGAVISERFGIAARMVGLTGSTGLAAAILRPVLTVGFAEIGHYSVCSGTFGRANDCLASKGFAMQRVRFAGVEIDVYDTHLDADPRDAPTRAVQLTVLAAAMQRFSAGRAVILGGDFNIERGDTTEFAALTRFSHGASLTDAGITSSAAWPEHLDYVFFRGSTEADISLRIAGEDPSFRTQATALSDHPAMYAILRVTPRRRPDGDTAH